MKRIYLFFFLMTLLSTSGCLLLTGKNVPPGPNSLSLDELIAARQYLLALQSLSESPDTPEKKITQERILKLIHELESETIRKANLEFEHNDPANALEIIDTTLAMIPASPALKELRDQIAAEHERKRRETERKLLLNKAEYLLTQVELYGEQARLQKPSLNTRWLINRMEHSLASLHGNLVDCGRKAVQSKHFDIAGRCLDMARKINDTEEVYHLLASVPTRQNFSEGQATKLKLSVDETNSEGSDRPAQIASHLTPEVLRSQVNQAIRQGDLLTAKKKLTQLQINPDGVGALLELTASFNSAVSEEVKKLDSEAIILYRSGKISQARDVWQNILSYDPANEDAARNIARANKVIDRLRELQESQATLVEDL